MSDDIDSGGAGVVKDGVNELSKVVNICPGVSLVIGVVGVGRAPSGDVEFSFGVSLRLEVLDEVSEASLPRSLSSSVANGFVGVTVDENDRVVDEGLVRAGSASV